MALSITSHRTGDPPERSPCGATRLSAEVPWLVQGDAELVAAVENELPLFCERVGPALLLRFGNAVGGFDGGPLGRLSVHSDKWGESDFDRMLGEIAGRLAILPFAASTGAERALQHRGPAAHRVLYHAFAYLRYLLSPAALPDDRLAVALRLILSRPHRRLRRVTQWSPLGALWSIEPRALLAAVTPRAALHRAPPGRAPAFARSLRGHLPEQLEETRAQDMLDVPENRFVKAFLVEAESIIERVRDLALHMKPGHFRDRLLADSDRMTRTLAPVRKHPLWREVSQMPRLPAESQVLQRGRGYREVFRSYIRLRQSARLLPMDDEATQHLLEIKDIAELYEMWCFFEVQRQVTIALGRPPILAETATVGDLAAHLGRGLRVAWDGDVELFYNLSHSRTGANRSYSVLLRPDIVLRVPRDSGHEDHVFDAKFKVRRIAPDIPDIADTDEENRGVFKRADLYKMHAYRDALPAVRSAWVLYPGTDLRFFAMSGAVANSVDELPLDPSGVGAVPLSPGGDNDIARIIGKLITRDETSPVLPRSNPSGA
ncbi:MAG: DUF2357 domain-containing protein [Nannocystales bacterium]